MFETLNNASEKGVDSGKKYIESTIKYAKLKIFKQLSVSAGAIVRITLVGIFIFLGIIFSAVSCALALAEVFESLIYGYLATGGIFFLLAIIMYLMRRVLYSIVIEKMSDLFYDENL